MKPERSLTGANAYRIAEQNDHREIAVGTVLDWHCIGGMVDSTKGAWSAFLHSTTTIVRSVVDFFALRTTLRKLLIVKVGPPPLFAKFRSAPLHHRALSSPLPASYFYDCGKVSTNFTAL